MKPVRLAIIAGAGIVALAVSAVVIAESLGVDTLLLAERMMAGGERPPAAPGHETATAAPPEPAPADADADKGGDLPLAREILLEHAAGLMVAGRPAPPPQPDEPDERDAAETKQPEAVSEAADADTGDSSEKPAPAEVVDAGEAPPEVAAFDPVAYILPPGPNQPWRLFRDLQRAQDQVVVGQPGALDDYRRLMADAGNRMLAAPAELWRHPRNVLSAAAYVMGGGNVEVARRVLAAGVPDGPEADLLRGALAYAQGQYFEAYRLFHPVRPQALPASLGGHVALVKAMLLSPRDLARAMEHLDLARQLAPGTLVEEAALRRQIRVLAETDDVNRFFGQAATYIRRFSRSAFLSDFLRNFAYGALKLSHNHEERVTAEIRQLESRLDTEARRYLLSIIARGATVFGDFELAREAVARSLGLNGNDERLTQRLRLYGVAASLTRTTTLDEATRALETFDPAALGGEDARLLNAARLVAEQIRKPLERVDLPEQESEVGPELAPPVDLSVGSTSQPTGDLSPLPPVIARSEALLKQAEEALGW
ncbi:MAG: hypothetical protein BroJett030_01150 [Alphaproteobacteria bacterium]|nr:MAG: hypothetical protein BroJett030_01150 [Alphaproteobacteria bacterium]